MNTNLNVQISDALKQKIDNKEDGFRVGGVFSIEHIRNGEVIATDVSPNIVVNTGLDYILDAALSGATPTTSFFIGIFSNNYTPQATNVMSTFVGAGVANEVGALIDNGTRPAWSEAGVVTRTLTNSASPASFTANGSVAVYGAFLTTSNLKSGTTGTLIAASKFNVVRNLENTDVLNVTYTLTIADA